MLKAGQFYTGDYPAGSGKTRRFVLVTDEDANDCTLVWVYTSTNMCDTTVVLPKGCHPLITDDCCVVYEQACVVKASDIQAAIGGSALVEHSPLPGSILAKIQEGIFESPETSDAVVEYCTDRI